MKSVEDLRKEETSNSRWKYLTNSRSRFLLRWIGKSSEETHTTPESFLITKVLDVSKNKVESFSLEYGDKPRNYPLPKPGSFTPL